MKGMTEQHLINAFGGENSPLSGEEYL